jgi:ferric-dicitrate binding protein FerR (iron transport regulator)
VENYYSFYEGFTEDQFVENTYFRQWVKYADNDTTAFWNCYLQLYPQQQQAILRAREKVKSASFREQDQQLTVEEKSILKAAIYQQINQPAKQFSMHRRKGLQVLKYAAIVSGIIIVTIPFLNKKPKAETFITAHTGYNETREILLADSTLVILNANSSISYNREIGNMAKREISLQGNAYFKVKKKADHRSFTVHANALLVTVLGTQFNVNARSRSTEVVLTSGKVKVSSDDMTLAPVYMNPGEKVQLDTLHHSFVKSNSKPLMYSAWIEGKWHFSSTSLLDITKLIYEYYGVEAFFLNEKAKRLKVSAVIPVTDLPSFINILSKTLDLKITEQNNQLHIKF